MPCLISLKEVVPIGSCIGNMGGAQRFAAVTCVPAPSSPNTRHRAAWQGNSQKLGMNSA